MALHGVTCSEVTVVYTRAEGDDTIRERSEPVQIRFENLADYLNSFFWRTEMDVTEIISVSLQNICTGPADSDAESNLYVESDESDTDTVTATESDNEMECVSDVSDAEPVESDSESDANSSDTECDD